MMNHDHGAIRKFRPQILGLLLLCWLLLVVNLDRARPLFEDESLILNPGYKLLTTGVYGLDMFAGYYSMEDRFFQFMPLFSLLQGAVLRLLGIGVYQARLLPAMIGLLTVAMTVAVATRLRGRTCALLALLLLLCWQWSAVVGVPNYHNHFVAGIPLIDLARLGRYDLLTALLGLCAFWCFLQATATRHWHYDLTAGLLVGLATLAHVNGLFWGGALFAALLVEQRWEVRQRLSVRAGYFLGGGLLTLLPWLLLLTANFDLFIHQLRLTPERFDLLTPAFYYNNLLTEYQRYFGGLRNGAGFAYAGFWLQLFGLPLAMVSLTRTVAQRKNRAALALLVMLLTITGAFALLLQPKTTFYLPNLLLLFTLAVAWALTDLLAWVSRPFRYALLLGLGLVMAQGAWDLALLHQAASQRQPPQRFLQEIRLAIPPGQRVLGMPEYWFALPEPGYRTYQVAIVLTDPMRHHAPLSFTQALAQIAPDYVVVDPIIATFFASPELDAYTSHRREFQLYMDRHQAQLVKTIRNNLDQPLYIYQLNP